MTELIDSLDTLKEYLASKDNAESFVYCSEIPEICKTEKCVLGVDEAGRGPVLGPMVYGISFCPISKKSILKDLGCEDSKQLTEAKRDEIFVKMNTEEYAKQNMGWSIEVISPNYLTMCMLRRTKHSLNEVSMDSAIKLIHKAIENEVNVAEIYVDTVGPPEKYQAKLKAIFPKIKITVAKKADSTYPIVSAASICAKVSRDQSLKVWKFREGIEIPEDGFGSGYPGDPVTKRFLEKFEPCFGYPRIVRFAWSTCDKALEKVAYKMEFEEEVDPNELSKKEKASQGTKKLTKFFKADTKIQRKFKRNAFFKERFLEDVESF